MARPQSAGGGAQLLGLNSGVRKISSERSAGAVFMRNTMDLPQPGSFEDIFAQNVSSSQQNLTTHVWPKSRMLFAIVSKMYVQGVVSEAERGILKDLILEHDGRLLSCLASYEAEGNRERLYQCFIDIANSNLQQNEER